jgi:hypothetical protein
MFEGLERPYEIEANGATQGSEPLESDSAGISPVTLVSDNPMTGSEKKKDEIKSGLPTRIFWIARLINQLAGDPDIATDERVILSHLPHAGGEKRKTDEEK